MFGLRMRAIDWIAYGALLVGIGVAMEIEHRIDLDSWRADFAIRLGKLYKAGLTRERMIEAEMHVPEPAADPLTVTADGDCGCT